MKPCRGIIYPAVCLAVLIVLLHARTSHSDCAKPREPTCAGGSSAGFFLFDENGHTCELYFLPDQVTTIKFYMSSVPIQKVRMTLPDPPVGIVVDEWWGVSHTGDRQTGMEIDLGGCSDLKPLIGELRVFVAGGTNFCGPWGVNEAESAVQDCEGIWRPAETPLFTYAIAGNAAPCPGCALSCGVCGLPPYDFYPLNGATQVPVDVTLTWKAHPSILLTGCHIQFVDSNCEEVSHFTVPCTETEGSYSFSPDFLEPETTYYWRPTWGANVDGGCSSGFYGVGPLHSFTTEKVSATESASWGKIKALYHR